VIGLIVYALVILAAKQDQVGVVIELVLRKSTRSRTATRTGDYMSLFTEYGWIVGSCAGCNDLRFADGAHTTRLHPQDFSILLGNTHSPSRRVALDCPSLSMAETSGAVAAFSEE
jgi:hypothetical protein